MKKRTVQTTERQTTITNSKLRPNNHTDIGTFLKIQRLYLQSCASFIKIQA